MTTYYKLTYPEGTTFGGTRWAPGVTHVATGAGTGLCSDGFIHGCEHPLLALLHNPIHGNFQRPRLWECESDDEPLRDGQMKLGVKSLTCIREMPVPEITLEQRVRYGILCAKAVYADPAWNRWADGWLDGTDRSAWAAAEAAEAAWAATRAANAASNAAWAARAANAASEAAARAARAAKANAATRAAAAAEAAEAAWAAWAAKAAEGLNLVVLAEKACAPAAGVV